MATITDNFNRADNDALGSSSEGWSWTEVEGDLDIVTNEVRGGAVGTNSARAESALSSADHYAQIVHQAVSQGNGPCVRYAAAAATYYVAYYDGSVRVFKIQSGSLTNLGSPGGSFFGAGHTLKLSISGSTLTVYDNGVQMGSTITDSDITGNTRTGMRADGTNDRMDGFEAGDLGGGGGGPAPTTYPGADGCGVFYRSESGLMLPDRSSAHELLRAA